MRLIFVLLLSGHAMAQPPSQLRAFNLQVVKGICDGNSHPLYGFFESLSIAQLVYPFISSLSQEFDYAAIKLASNASFGPDGGEHGTNTSANVPLYIPPGVCYIGNDTWTIRNADGISIYGAGMTATTIQSNSTVLAVDGLWYSSISNIGFVSLTNSAIVAVDLDGNVPGHPYPTRGTQGNQLSNVIIGGGNSSYSLALCREGGSAGQCSENQYVNLHLHGAMLAAYYQNGFNALDNNWFGGDCQSYETDCVQLIEGSIGLFKVSFESTFGYQQILNGGWDIDASSGGVNDGIPVYGCRSESLRFYNGGGSQNPDIRAFTQNPAGFSTWNMAHNYILYALLDEVGVDGKVHLYVATTSGTSGGSQPIWPTSGTVSDGGVVWTEVSYNVIDLVSGNFDFSTSYVDPSALVQQSGTNWAIGTNTYDGTAWTLRADGGSAALEVYIKSQNPRLGQYCNPQASTFNGISGFTYPSGSCGLFAWGDMTLGAGAVERMRIKSGGNVGIGSINPGSLLTIKNGDLDIATASNGLILIDTVTGTCSRIQLTSGVLTPTILACPGN
jgi:hypothetical protein